MKPTEKPRVALRSRAAAAPKRAERRLVGIPVAPGIGIGPLFATSEARPEVPRLTVAAEAVEAEVARLDVAVRASRKQLGKLRERLAALPDDISTELDPLMEAYQRMLAPGRLLRGAHKRVEARQNAEAAISDEAEALAAAFLAGTDPAAARHAEEVREVARRIVRNLTHTPFRSFAGAPEGSVLLAEWLRPSDAALLDPAKLVGVATEEGGADGHTAVMLRALGVPAVLGAAGLTGSARPGALAIVDGSDGVVILDPTPATITQARRRIAEHAGELKKLSRLRALPAVTTDHVPIELQANLELPVELKLVARSGAAGIGLLRSEFIFMNRDDLPDEDTQAELYRSVIAAMDGDPVTIRVLDWGGEKEIEALEQEGLVPAVAGDNPALGLRGIRLLLRQPELFETQLAAILRAANAGPTRVLLPMVTALSEVREAREVYERVIRRLRRRGETLPAIIPPLGIMIETPAAALSADAMALESDFFAIGTNDLSMYTLAIDRGETDLTQLYDPLHPAVLRLIQFATEAALRVRKPVSVCGEMASNPRWTKLLLGLGIRSLSMNAASIPRVKQAIRALSMDECIRFARRVMELADPAHIAREFEDFEREE